MHLDLWHCSKHVAKIPENSDRRTGIAIAWYERFSNWRIKSVYEGVVKYKKLIKWITSRICFRGRDHILSCQAPSVSLPPKFHRPSPKWICMGFETAPFKRFVFPNPKPYWSDDPWIGPIHCNGNVILTKFVSLAVPERCQTHNFRCSQWRKFQ